MNKIFLGKLSHWLTILALIPLGTMAGTTYYHVTHFNMFILFLAIYTICAMIIVLKTTKPDEQVTREPIDLSLGIDEPDKNAG